MDIRFFLPFLFALPAMAQTPEEIVFTVSVIPHRLVVENANHQQKRLLLALNPKATAFFVLEGEADITAFIGFITEAKAVFFGLVHQRGDLWRKKHQRRNALSVAGQRHPL